MINRRHALGLLAAASTLPDRSFANVSYQRSEFRDDLAKRFFDLGTVGTFVGYKVDDYLIIASDKVRSGEGKLPASTFKIPNSLIALETGVVADPDKDVFKWDGVTRSIEAWNKDHTLRSAIAVSAVPVYQEIARRIGAERMQKYVDLFDYGNRDIGGGIDQFWLTGNLRIDPVQQIDFVDRLRRGVLPVSKRSQELVRDILPVTKVGDATIRAKSGLLGAEQGKPSLGWMVGWAEKGSSAHRVRHEHGLQGAKPHRRAHDGDAAMPRRHRGDLIGRSALGWLVRRQRVVLACPDHHGAVHAASSLGFAGRLGAFASASLRLGPDLSRSRMLPPSSRRGWMSGVKRWASLPLFSTVTGAASRSMGNPVRRQSPARWRHGFRDRLDHQGVHGAVVCRHGAAGRGGAGRSRREISARQREDAGFRRRADHPA